MNKELALYLGLSQDEMKALSHGSIKGFQEYLDDIPYDFDEGDGDHFPSVRMALRKGKFSCFSGALMGAAYIYLNDIGPPLILCIEAYDIDHNIAVYWRNSKVGSVAASRQAELKGRPALYNSYRDLVLSYYPYFYNLFTNDRNEITMRGISAPVDLRIFDNRWIAGEDDLTEIEDYLYAIPYFRLLPENKQLYEGLPTHGPNLYWSPRQ